MRRLLMVAYHFPPLAGSSGIQRTLRFARHLPALGWEPLVLTIAPRAYGRTSDDLLREIPAGLVVERAFGLDTARHLALAGRYPGFLARPDRFLAWRLGGWLTGRRMIRRYRPAAIWSTFPVATAHSIGADLAEASGLPWIADFRDPMAQEGYPEDPATWAAYRAVEARAFRLAAATVVTTPGTARFYANRYPACASRLGIIENGYDEESFAGLAAPASPLLPGRFVLLHSGIVYPSERDPSALIAALGQFRRAGTPGADRLVLRFRAAVHEDLLRDLAARHGVEEQVEVAPALPYRAALAEMLAADGLLVLQAANCNDQIPAKLYEYLRCGRPVLGLTDPLGDTAWALKRAGVSLLAPLNDEAAIERLLARTLAGLVAGDLPGPAPGAAREASREARSRELADLLARVVPPPRGRRVDR